MEFWHLQMQWPHGPDGGLEINPMDMLQNTPPVIGTGEWANHQCSDFKNRVKKGDIVCVRKGKKAVALCEVVGDNFNDQELEKKFINHNYRRINLLDTNPPARDFPQTQGTLTIAEDKEKATWNFINDWYNAYKMKEIKELLEYKKQIILQGPPGTGKTHTAKEIAEKITKSNKENWKIIQFHPAYSYEDFVRGIVATKTEEGSISYEVVNKTLAEFAQKLREIRSKMRMCMS